MDKNKTKGMFHQFDREMRECLLTVAIEDAPVTISTNRDDLDKQQEVKRKKEELIEKKSLDKAKEDLVKASYYREMFHSEVCWKGKPSVVTDVGLVEIRDCKDGGAEREYKDAYHWIGMETIRNHLVLQRSKAIGERAGCTSLNDLTGGEEAYATEGSGFDNAQALRVATATKQLM